MLIHLDVKSNTTMSTCNFHVKFTILIGLKSPFHHLGPYFLTIHLYCRYAIPKLKTKHVHNHFPNKYVDPSVLYLIYSSLFAHYKNHT